MQKIRVDQTVHKSGHTSVNPWATLDALPDRIAVLDRHGTIIATNEMWRRSTRRDGFVGAGYQSNANYLDMCTHPLEPTSDAGQAIAHGIRSIINQQRETFELEYASHSQAAPRWYLVRISRFTDAGQFRLLVVHQDISERKQTEHQLRLLESVIVHSEDAVLITHADLIDQPGPRIMYVNQAFTRMTGYQPHEAIGQTPRMLQGPGTSRATLNTLRQALERAEPAQVELLNYRKDGSEFWVEIDIVPVCDDHGKLTHFISIQRETTGRKQAEEALRASEERYRSIFEHATIGIFQSTPEGSFLSANPALARMLGYNSPQELIEQINDIGEQIYARHEHRSEIVDMICASPQAIKTETRYRRKDGVEIVANVNAWAVRDEQGQVCYLEGFLEDISEQKQGEAERHLQAAALEAASHGIVITDRAGTIRWVNPAFSRLTGYTTREIIGQTPRIQKSGFQEEPVYRQLWYTIQSGQVWYGEIVNRRKDGTLHTDEVTITPVRDHQTGEITHFIGIHQDITERKQRERELEAITTVSAALRVAHSRAEMQHILLAHIHDLLKSDGAALVMHEPHHNGLKVVLAQGVWSTISGHHLPPMPQYNGETSASSSSSAVQLLNEHTWIDPRIAWPHVADEPHHVARTLLTAQDHPLGMLWVGRSTPFCASELRVLAAIGDIAANAIHRATLHEQLEQRLRRLAAVNRIDRAISASSDLGVTLDVVLPQVTTQLGVDAAAILLLNPQTRTLHCAAEHGFQTTSFQHSALRLGEGHAGRIAIARQPISVPDIHKARDMLLDDTRLLESEQFVAYYGVPIISKGQIKGVLELFHHAPLSPDQEWIDFLDTLAGQVAIAVDNAELVENLQHSNDELTLAYDATIEGWARALEMRDAETVGHSRRVTELTMQFARQLRLDDTDLVHIRRGAILHDIGKMAIPDRILLKSGPLNEEEWAIMRQHPVYAYKWLAPISYLRPALDIPLFHHEKWDGSGYPHGLRGEEIPLAARMFAIVDVWDALCSDRPYRAGWAPERVCAYIQQQAGSHFDPRLVKIFLRLT